MREPGFITVAEAKTKAREHPVKLYWFWKSDSFPCKIHSGLFNYQELSDHTWDSDSTVFISDNYFFVYGAFVRFTNEGSENA